MSKTRYIRLAKEGFWIVAGKIAAVAGSLVLVRVLTSSLEPSQYGELALGLTIAGLVNQVVMGGVNNGIGRFYSIAADMGDLRGYLKASCKLMIYATLVVGVIAMVLIAGLVWCSHSQWIALVAATLAFSLLTGYNSSLNQVQNAARQRAVVAFHDGINAWLKIGLAVAFVLWLGASSTAVVVGYLLAMLIVTVSQILFLKKTITCQVQIKPEIKQQQWMRRICVYSWPFSVWGIFTWAHLASDRWALDTFCSREMVGQYAVVYQLGYFPIIMLTDLTVAFIGPILYQRAGDATDVDRNRNVHNITSRMTILSLLMTALACVFCWVFHKPIFTLLVAEPFRNYSGLLPWIVLAGGLFAAAQILALRLMTELKSAVLTTAKITTASFGVLFNIIGARLLGVSGVILAMLAFSCFYLVWMLWLSLRNRIPLKQNTGQRSAFSITTS
jgi:O-antigen/teichoic acid export membrane protein